MDRRILSNDRSRCRSPRPRFVGSEHRSGPGAERCAAVRLSARLLLPKRVPKLRLPAAFRLPAGGDTKARGTQQRPCARAEEHRWVRRSRAEQRAPREGVAAGRVPVPRPPPAATSTFLRRHRVSRSRSRCARCCGNAAQRRSGTERGGRAGTAPPSAGRSPALQQRTAVPGPRTKTALTQQSEGGGRRTGAAAELCRQRIEEGAVITARGQFGRTAGAAFHGTARPYRHFRSPQTAASRSAYLPAAVGFNHSALIHRAAPGAAPQHRNVPQGRGADLWNVAENGSKSDRETGGCKIIEFISNKKQNHNHPNETIEGYPSSAGRGHRSS